MQANWGKGEVAWHGGVGMLKYIISSPFSGKVVAVSFILCIFAEK